MRYVTESPVADRTGRFTGTNRRSPLRSLAIAFAGLALFALVAAIAGQASGGTVASADSERVPFSGVMVNQDASDGAFPVTTVTIMGELTATYVGTGQVSGEATINILGLVQGGCSELIEGVINFIAPDGSELNMVMTSNAACFEPNGEISFTADYDITGGSGRFEDAEGAISAAGVIDLASGESVGTLSGSISLDDDNLAQECNYITSSWFVDEAGVTQIRGDLDGWVETLLDQFVVTGVDGSVISFTVPAITHDEDGDLFAASEGTFDVVTGQVEFVNAYTGGTGDWTDVYGLVHVTGIDGVGGDSSGWLCVPDNDDEDDDDKDDDDKDEDEDDDEDDENDD